MATRLSMANFHALFNTRLNTYVVVEGCVATVEPLLEEK